MTMKTIKIKDYYGKYQEIPVSDELFEEWRALQNETQRVYRREMYHRSGVPLEEIDITIRCAQRSEIEDDYIRQFENRRLYEAISQLSDIQRRRIHMYMENMSVREIARQEGCHMNAVLKSVNSALAKVRRLLEDCAP